jgi:inosine-uridine nucleoside N-ribohydrolase
MPFRRVIVDTDPGIDDAQAILFAFLCQEVEIDAVTSVFGNVPVDFAALNALRLVELAGRPMSQCIWVPPSRFQRRLHFAPTVHGEDGLATSDGRFQPTPGTRLCRRRVGKAGS